MDEEGETQEVLRSSQVRVPCPRTQGWACVFTHPTSDAEKDEQEVWSLPPDSVLMGERGG